MISDVIGPLLVPILSVITGFIVAILTYRAQARREDAEAKKKLSDAAIERQKWVHGIEQETITAWREQREEMRQARDECRQEIQEQKETHRIAMARMEMRLEMMEDEIADLKRGCDE